MKIIVCNNYQHGSIRRRCGWIFRERGNGREDPSGSGVISAVTRDDIKRKFDLIRPFTRRKESLGWRVGENRHTLKISDVGGTQSDTFYYVLAKAAT